MLMITIFSLVRLGCLSDRLSNGRRPVPIGTFLFKSKRYLHLPDGHLHLCAPYFTKCGYMLRADVVPSRPTPPQPVGSILADRVHTQHDHAFDVGCDYLGCLFYHPFNAPLNP